MKLPRFPLFLRRLRPHDLRPGSVLLFLVVSVLLVVGSIALALSLGVEITRLGSTTISGTLDTGRTVIGLSLGLYSHAEAMWADPSCGVRFHFLTPADFAAYESSESLPSALLTCDRTAGVVPGTVSYVIVVNDREPGVNYTIEFELFSVTRPAAWLALPALVMIFGASIGIITVFLSAALSRFPRPNHSNGLGQQTEEELEEKK